MANIKISWTGDTGSYEVQYKKSNATSWSEPNGSPYSALEATITGLDSNTPYSFRVRGVAGNQVGGWKYQSFVTSTAGCAPVTSFTLGSVSTSTITVTFVASGTAVNGYFIEYKRDDVLSWSSTPTFTSTSYTLTGLTAGKIYNVRVVSRCTAGAETRTAIKSATTTTTLTQCAAISVTGLSTTENTSNYTASWTNTGGTPATVNLEYSIDGGSTFIPFTNVVSQTASSITYVLPPSISLFPRDHHLRVTPKCSDNSLGTSGTTIYTAPEELVQFVTFENELDEDITFLSINNNPNILEAPIGDSLSLDYNEEDLFTGTKLILMDAPDLAVPTTVTILHIRGGDTLSTNSVVYSGEQIPIFLGGPLADQDIIRIQ